MQREKPLEKLMTKEMSRREFIGFMAAATLGIVGVTSIVRGLHGAADRHLHSGYGSSPYGRDSTR